MKMLLVTTGRDLSVSFFKSIANVQCDVAEFGKGLPLSLLDTYDIVYFRDPFVVSGYSLSATKRTISDIHARYPHSYYIDRVESLTDILFEDKWLQYQYYRQYMPLTAQVGEGKLAQGMIAKKRISSRARDIVFPEDEVSFSESDADIFIMQEKIDIIREYRVYVVCGDVLPLVSIKQSKTVSQKAKVTDILAAPIELLEFVKLVLLEGPRFDLIGLDVAETKDGYVLIEVNRAPQFVRYNQILGVNLAAQLVEKLHRNIYFLSGK